MECENQSGVLNVPIVTPRKERLCLPPQRPNPFYGLILVGPEGSGKTRLSRLLAPVLGWKAMDADDLVPPGRDLVQSQLCGDRYVLAYRQRAMENAVLNRPRHPIILATTLRFLNRISSPARRERVKDALSQHWVLIHLQRELETTARFFYANPDARSRRFRLHDCQTLNQICERLQAFREECAPLYSRLTDASVRVRDNDSANLLKLQAILQEIRGSKAQAISQTTVPSTS